MRSIEWTLLEFAVPVITWLHLDVAPLPHLAVAVALLLLLGALIAALVTCARLAHPSLRLRLTPVARNLSWRSDALPVNQTGPIGGCGPRAPAAIAAI